MLHIYNGDSTAGTAGKAAISGEHLAWREALVCGPAPGWLGAEQFRGVRARHLAEAYGVKVEKSEAELREQEEALARFSNHEEGVLWIEHDLFCQIHLIYLLNWFSQLELGTTKLSLICIGEFPGIEDFRGLGQLDEEQLASLFPQRLEVTKAELELGARAWKAYSSSNPIEIEALISDHPLALRFLNTALTKHLQRFPSAHNGLGRIENVVLELIRDGYHEFESLFPAFARRESAYGFGDAQVFLELKRLATSTHPLLTINKGDSASPTNSCEFAGRSFRITERGKAVLNGDEDFVELNGIDLWLGGVHLEGKEAAWRWDEAARTLFCEPNA